MDDKATQITLSMDRWPRFKAWFRRVVLRKGWEDFYVGGTLSWSDPNNPSGPHQERKITKYDGTTKTATIGDWEKNEGDTP